MCLCACFDIREDENPRGETTQAPEGGWMIPVSGS